MGKYDFSRVKAVALGGGAQMRLKPSKHLLPRPHLEVFETGMWCDESGVLGASPDG